MSHRLGEVLDLADRVTVLRDGRRVGTRDVRELDESSLVEMIVGRPLDRFFPDAAPEAADREPVLRVRGLVAGPLRGVDLDLHRGEVLGVAGLLGSGRSELLAALFGDLPVTAGEVTLNGEPLACRTPKQAMARGIALVPEDRAADALLPGLSVRENLSAAVVPGYWRRLRLQHGRERSDARSLVERFGVRPGSDEPPVATLSGGNQQKVVLGRWLRRSPTVLLLDEPTQGVDVNARAEIYRHVRETVAQGTSVLLVTSDFEEMAHVVRPGRRPAGRPRRRGAAPTRARRRPARRAVLPDCGGPCMSVTSTGAAPAAETEAGGSPTAPRPRSASAGRLMALFERYALLLLLVLLCVFFSTYASTAETFPTAANIRNVIGNEAVIAIAALASIVPLTAGQFDLSVGSVVGLSSIVAASATAQHDLPTAVGVLLGVGIGGLVGLFNGLLVARAGVNPLIATLGSSTLIAGLVSLYTADQIISLNIPRSITELGSGLWLGVPRTLYALILVSLLTYYVLQHTPFGRYLASVGANPQSARLVGLRVNGLVVSSFVCSGLLSGVAGILLLARAGTANPQVGPGFTLAALSAAFLGATAIRPGRFNVVGTLLGVLFVAVSVNGLVLAGAADWVEPTFNGTALILAVALSTMIARRRAGRA